MRLHGVGLSKRTGKTLPLQIKALNFNRHRIVPENFKVKSKVVPVLN
jgi:hypothetical protein